MNLANLNCEQKVQNITLIVPSHFNNILKKIVHSRKFSALFQGLSLICSEKPGMIVCILPKKISQNIYSDVKVKKQKMCLLT